MVIFNDNFNTLNEFLSTNNYSKFFILVDENTHEFCLSKVLGEIETEIPIEILEIESGEENKNIETCTQLWWALSEFRADRKALLINIGGGVITDMGGFVASVYKRGIDFVNIPTTLLSQVDASVGGKTGIDLGSFKNQIGTFNEANLVIIETDFLNTLPYEQVRSGFAEMIKHGLIQDKNHFEELSNLKDLNIDNLSKFIKNSINIKSKVVEEDFQETGLRKILNFGHTIGHAIEGYFLEQNTPILHGDAVACGIICESYISKELNFINNNDYIYIKSTINKFFPKINWDKKINQKLLDLMKNDKKNQSSIIQFSLLNKIGEGNFNIEVPENIIIKSFEDYIN